MNCNFTKILKIISRPDNLESIWSICPNSCSADVAGFSDCCKQSLKKLLHPSIHPSIHTSRNILFVFNFWAYPFLYNFFTPFLIALIIFLPFLITFVMKFTIQCSNFSQLNSSANFAHNYYISLANFLIHHNFCKIV